MDALRRDDESAYLEILSLLENDDSPIIPPDVPQPLLKPGDTLGRYTIVEFIEEGGMGEVYKASHPELGARVLKILSRELAENTAFIERLRLEAKAANALNHRNIVTIHDFDRQGHLQFMVMEFVEGQSLRKMIGTLPVEEAVDYATQMAQALGFAHSKGIIHRDIKPENVMVRPDGVVKILDFGLAKPVSLGIEAGGDGTMRIGPTEMKTDPHILLGTLRYMAPEQLDYKGASSQSDIWSWGVVCYEMLAGRRPFEASTDHEVMEAIKKRVPGPPCRYRELNRIVVKALRKKPDERYGAMAEAAEELKNFMPPSWARRVVMLALLALILFAGYQVIVWSGNTQLQVVSQPVPLLKHGGHARLPAISPEGKKMIYIDKDNGESILRLVEIVDGAMSGDRIIARSRDAKFAGTVFAPNDDQTIYVLLQHSNGSGVIYRMRLAADVAGARATDTPVAEADDSRWSPTPLLLSLSGDHGGCQDHSPDVASLAWYRRASGSGRFEPVCPNHPEAAKLAPDASADSPPSFSPDGRYFVFSWISPLDNAHTLFVGRAEGGPESHLTPEKVPPFPYLHPLWSPDGQSILTATRVSDDSNVCRIKIKNGEQVGKPKCQTIYGLFRGKPAWINNGRSIVVSASRKGLSKPQLLQIYLDGGDHEITYPDSSKPRDLDSITCPQGIFHPNCPQMLIAASEDDRTDVWIEDLGQRESNDRYTYRVTKEAERLYGITWMDNDNVISESERGKFPDLLVTNVNPNRGDQTQRWITNDPKTESDPVVSPDGRYLVYASNQKGGIHLWRVDLAKPNAAPIQLTSSGSVENQPSISTDSQWVIFTSDESGGQALKKVPMQGGKAISIQGKAPGPGYRARNASFSPDGQHILCEYLDLSKNPANQLNWTIAILDRDGNVLQQFPEIELFPDIDMRTTPARWSKDGKSILYIKKKNGTQNVWTKAIQDGGVESPVTHLGVERIFAFALSPDGARIAYLSGPEPTSQIFQMQLAK